MVMEDSLVFRNTFPLSEIPLPIPYCYDTDGILYSFLWVYMHIFEETELSTMGLSNFALYTYRCPTIVCIYSHVGNPPNKQGTG